MIHVTPLSHLRQVLAASRAGHLISLLSVGAHAERPAQIPPARWLHLAMHDITEEREGYVAPSLAHVGAIIDFARGWKREAPLVVHCYAGISRSTAAAYIIAAALRPDWDEAALARKLRRLSPSATPNPRLVALADELLDRHGRMRAAIAAIGRGDEAFEGSPFALPLD
ncbi:protein tyrosine phosphatase [Acetobacteraceae bacterium H6797]|nr:protein tyrosine phosphatase [Acetobacteraceae bacterium H6797]